MARNGFEKESIKQRMKELFNYNIDYSIDDIREYYGWRSERFGNGRLCQNSVPQAICAFLDGSSFEDCIRNAISIGGDSDTIACIAGGIAEAYYGIPKSIYNKGLTYLEEELEFVVKEFEEKFGNNIKY